MKQISKTVNFDILKKWMDEQGLENGPIRDAALLTGGTQNILIRFKRGDSEFVFRRPPEHLRKHSNSTMQREARMLRALSGTKVPHPRLIASCSDDAVMGASFYLMEPIDGFNLIEGLPLKHKESAELRYNMGLSIVDGATELGKIDHLSAGLHDFGRAEKYLERQVDRWSKHLLSYRDFDNWNGEKDFKGIRELSQWLESELPNSSAAGIIHGDYHLGNVIFEMDSARLAAIVDWELTTIGDPLLDLGWLLATWPETPTLRPEDVGIEPFTGFPSHRELIERYSTGSSRNLKDINWYAVLACFKMGIIVEGTYARACAGLAPKETGERLHQKAVGLFERALRWIETPLA